MYAHRFLTNWLQNFEQHRLLSLINCFYFSLNDESEKVVQPQAMPNKKLCIGYYVQYVCIGYNLFYIFINLCPISWGENLPLQTFKSFALFRINHLVINEKEHWDNDITTLIDRD